MSLKKQHIYDIIDTLPHLLQETPPTDSSEPIEVNADSDPEKFKELHGTFPFQFPNVDDYIALIESNLLGVLNDQPNSLKTIIISRIEDYNLLKMLPILKNSEKIEKIIIKFAPQRAQDDPFKLLLRCTHLFLKEIEVSCAIFAGEFKNYIENKGTKHLQVLTMNFQNTQQGRDALLAINPTNCPNLKKLVLTSHISYQIPLYEIFNSFKSKSSNKSNINIELNLYISQWGDNPNLGFDSLKKLTEIPLEISIKASRVSQYDEPDFKRQIEQMNIQSGGYIKHFYINQFNQGSSFLKHMDGKEFQLLSLHIENIRMSSEQSKFLNSNSDSDTYKFLKILEICGIESPSTPYWLQNLLALENLEELMLTQTNYLSNKEWIDLVKSPKLQNLRKLDFSNSINIDSAVIKEVCSSFKKLQILSLTATHLIDDSLEHIEKLNGLNELFIGLNDFTESGISSLIKSDAFKSLRNLSLSSELVPIQKLLNLLKDVETDLKLKTINGCGYKYISEILECKKLKNFAFYDNLTSIQELNNYDVMAFGDSHVKNMLNHPEYMKKLWFIKLVLSNEDKITEGTLQNFANSQGLNPFFQRNHFLSLFTEEITSNVLKLLENNELFMKYLYKLDVKKFNKLSEEGILAIFNSDKISRLFDWNGFLKGIKENPTLEPIKEQLLKHFPIDELYYLKKLDFSGFDLQKLMLMDSEQFFKIFDKPLPNLKELNLSKTKLDEKAIRKLFPSEGAKNMLNSFLMLSLNDNPTLSEEGFNILFDFFTESHKLLGLEVDKCQITNENLRVLTKKLKNLRYLSIKECNKIDDEGLEMLIHFSEVNKNFKLMQIYEDYKDSLCIANEKINIPLRVEDAFKIQRILVNNQPEEKEMDLKPKLKQIKSNVSNIVLKKFLEKEKRIETFKKLDFSNCPIDSIGLKYIADCKFLNNLESLSLKNTNILDEGIQALTESKNLSLKKLEIQGCSKLTAQSLKYIIDCKNFDNDFNPEKILENYAHFINHEILEHLDKSDYTKIVKNIYFKPKNLYPEMDTSDKLKLLFICLQKLIDLDKKNLNIHIEDFPDMMQNLKHYLKDEFLENFVNTKMFSELENLELDIKVTKHIGLKAIMESSNLNKNFKIQELIINNIDLMSDCVLESLSKSRCFEKFQYDTKLSDKKKKEKEEDPKNEQKNEENVQKEQEDQTKLIKNEITSEGLWFLSLSSNENFHIQGLINDFAEMITSSFVKNMVQQPYFRKICKSQNTDKGKEASIASLNLSKCVGLKDDDLCVIIRTSHPDFDLEEFIKKDNLPNKDINLVTNNVLKTITKSAYIQKHYCKESSPFTDFKRFSFDVSKYPKVDYAINDLIQAHASQIRYYAVYLQNYTAYLSSGSLRIMRNDIRNYKIFNVNMMNKHKLKDELIKDVSILYNDEEKIFDLLLKIKVLKFSQNKFIYDPSFETSLKGAFVNFQNQNDLNLNSQTIDYYIKKIVTIQEKHSSAELFDQDHEVLLDLIKHCNNLEEINLNNINLGDDFLKHFSIYLSERSDHFKNLEVLEIKNNERITSVGLKYLYCSIINRCNVLTTIKVYEEEETLNPKTMDIKSFTTFVNNGLKGMIDLKLKQTKKVLVSNYHECIFREVHPKKKQLLESLDEEEDGDEGRFASTNKNLRRKNTVNKNLMEILDFTATMNGSEKKNMKTSFKVKFVAGFKFMIRTDTLVIVGVFFLFTPLLLFHLFEKIIFAVPQYINLCFLSMKNRKGFKMCMKPIICFWRYVLEKFYDCFGNCFHFSTGDKSPKRRIPIEDRHIQLKEIIIKPNKNKEKMEKDQKRNNTHPIETTDRNDRKEEETEQIISKLMKKMEEEYDKKIKIFIENFENKKTNKSNTEEKPGESLKSPDKSPDLRNDETENLLKNKKDDTIEENKETIDKKEINPQKQMDNIPEDKTKETNDLLKDEPENIEKRTSNNAEETGPQKQKKKPKKSLTSLFCCCMSCYKIKEAGKKDSRKELMERYQKCKEEILKESFNVEENLSPPTSPIKVQSSGITEENNQSTQPKSNKEKILNNVNYSSYFYYDESLIKLNAILSGQSLKKTKINSVQPINEVNPNEEKEDLEPNTTIAPFLQMDSKIELEKGKAKPQHQPFLIISILKWVILFDFLSCYILVLFYLPYLKLSMHEDANLSNQIPYFVYGFCSFLLEVCICWEVTSVINNEELTSMWDSTILSNLITSQTAKYDTFTNLTFVFLNLKYNPAKNSFEFNEIFIPAMIFVGLNIVLNFKNFLGFMWKNFISKKKNRRKSFHSSEFINRYSKLSFQFEFQSLGRLLDRFSTNSAKKYGYWFLPKILKNSYIPTVITTTFARLFLEDVPLLIIQLYVVISKSVFDFTNIASLASTILALFMTLHTTWNVKPSIFNKNLFKGFFEQTRKVRENLMKELKGQMEEKKERKRKEEEMERNANKDNAATEELTKQWNNSENDNDQSLLTTYWDGIQKTRVKAIEEKENEEREKEGKGKEKDGKIKEKEKGNA